MRTEVDIDLADALSAFRALAREAPERFRTAADVREEIEAAVRHQASLCVWLDAGLSEEGRPIYGAQLGHGRRVVSLIAGAHADEPVGPETLRTILGHAPERADLLAPLFEAFTFLIIPQINPDGEAANRRWTEHWPDVAAYLLHTARELPGRDLEFGYPAMRAENRAVSAMLARHAPISLHMSLHGMGFAEGVMLLIDRHWAGRTRPLQQAFVESAGRFGLPLHDHNRRGEKGFFYIGPGFTTTPEGAAMRAHFQALGDEETAARFHDSSMEFVRGLGGDPLCLVTELPLFLLPRDPEARCGEAPVYGRFKDDQAGMTLRLARGGGPDEVLSAFEPRPLPLNTAIALQLEAIALGLETITEWPPAAA
jgi:hypothetical protein